MAQKLLIMLQEFDDWINRSSLAQKMQKNALNKWDVALLNNLAERDFICVGSRRKCQRWDQANDEEKAGVVNKARLVCRC